MDLCDADMVHSIKLKLLFFSKCRDQFFTASCDLEEVNTCASTGEDWKCSPYLQIATTHTRSTTSARELTNCNTATPHQALRPTMTGAKKNLSNYAGFIKTHNNSLTLTLLSVHAINRISELITRNSVLL